MVDYIIHEISRMRYIRNSLSIPINYHHNLNLGQTEDYRFLYKLKLILFFFKTLVVLNPRTLPPQPATPQAAMDGRYSDAEVIMINNDLSSPDVAAWIGKSWDFFMDSMG